MEFRILGPLEVRNERGTVALGGMKPRALLAVLLLHRNEPVTADRLALEVWGEEAPHAAVKTVQVHISRLRKALSDADIVTTTSAGYCLHVRPDELDAERFERLVDDATHALADGQAERAAAGMREALALWRGPPLADLAFEPFARAEIARLEEQRLVALETRIEADVAVGRHAEVIGELQQILSEHPLRERLAAQLMLALYRCGRQAEALEVYGEVRRALIAEIGVEPGPELRRLQEAILRQDVALEAQPAVAELPPELDVRAAPALVGRRDELAWLSLRWGRAREGASGLVTLAGVAGSGKLRLAAELAATAHDGGAAVLYANGSGPAHAFHAALQRTLRATGPTLLVVHRADRAGAAELAELEAVSQALEDLPVLVLVCGQDLEALADLRSDGVLMLESLDAGAVAQIARQYARGTAVADVPAGWLLEASGGIPRKVHEVSRQWARREAARYVGAVAGRAAAGREELRSIQAELTGGVQDLQGVDERATPRRWEAPVVCPFKGLASFDVADAEYFFGREKLVAELVARVVGMQLLGIVGPSGSGKSSVMRAGLLPALASGVLPGSDTWKQVLIRPGEHPLRELTDAMAATGESEHIVVAVDQFEETFTTCEDEAERAAFIAELGAVAGEREGRVVVVIALRADFYGRCAAYPELAEQLAANHVLVGSMQRDELRRAIELPARRVGLRVDTELADALVADVKDEPGALPLLSTALLELWQRRDGRRLRYSVYQQTGGVHGAVARLAEEAFRKLDDEQQAVARGVLMRLAGEGAAGGVERRRVALSELETERNEVAGRVVALLTDRRLLTVSAGTVELAHEALMREWPRLRDWIDADREGLRIHRNLNAAAREWEELGRDDGALYRGARLTEAAEWNDAQKPRLNESERAFLTASEAGLVRDHATRRRRTRMTGTAVATLAAAIAASVVAVLFANQARNDAGSRDLASSSAAVVDSNPSIALAIGFEALKRHDTDEARNAVRQATLGDRASTVVNAEEAAIYRAALSPDESLLATASESGTVRVVDLDKARVVSTIKASKAPVTDVAFSPDGKHVASASVTGEVAISEPDGRSRRVVLRVAGEDVYPRSIQYDGSGGRLLVAVHGTDEIRLVGVGDSHSTTLARHPGVRVARFSPNGRRVLSAGEDKIARVWDLAGHTTMVLRHGSDIFDARFSPDGRSVATAGADGAVRLWSARTGRLLKKLALDVQPLYSVRFSRDSRRLVVGGADGVVRVVDVGGGPLVAELKDHRDRVYDASFIGDGNRVVSVGTDGTARTWTLLKTAVLPADDAEPPTVPSFGPGGKLVVSGYVGGHVRLWNPATNSIRELPKLSAYSVALFSENGAYVLSSDDHKLRLYDVKKRVSSPVPVSAHEIMATAIDRTGRRIAVAGAASLGDHVVIQARDGTARVSLPANGQMAWLAFSRDGKHLLSAAEDGKVRIWNAASGALEHVLQGGEGGMLQAQFSSDGDKVAGAGADGTVRIWRLDGSKPLVLYGHDGPVTSIDFNPDGSQVVSGGKDGTVRIWDAGGDHMRVLLRRHGGEVAGVAFSSDGRRVLSGATDGIVVSQCEVCGRFADVLALAKTRPHVSLSPAERARLEGD